MRAAGSVGHVREDTYRERLWAPASYWIIALLIGVSVAGALGFYFGPAAMLGLVAVTAVGIAVALVAYGSAVIEVSDEGLRAGGMRVPWPVVSGATALDRDQARERLGVSANAAAALLVRPYLTQAVEVGIADPDDPHPYWLIGTRHPRRLAAAVESRLGHAATARPDDVTTKE